MATKPKSEKVDKPTEKKVEKPQNITKRERVVAKEPKETFDQRTNVTPPWMNADGTQNNG